MAVPHVGDVNTAFTMLVRDKNGLVNLATVTSKTMRFKPPTGDPVDVEADFVTDGTDAKIRYRVTDPTFLYEAGTWKLQYTVQFPDGRFHTSIHEFPVDGNL
jgi:hypothetical protein